MQRYDLNSIVLGITEHSTIQVKNVWEIGSRDGNDAMALASYFNVPNELVYIFEPIPELCHEIIQRYPRTNTFNHAVSDKAGMVDFTVEANNIGASSLHQRINPSEDHKVIQVEAVTMETVIETLGIDSIDVLKLDTEGHSLNVLRGFGRHLDKLQSIQVECEHRPIWSQADQFSDVSDFLTKNGYTMIMFTLLRATQSDSFWLKNDKMIL